MVNQASKQSTEVDPLIDEVRQLRADICERANHDIDRLANELRQTGEEYDAHRGVFSAVSPEAAARVVASWGDVSGPTDDAIVEEVRAIRTNPKQDAPAAK